MSKDIIKTIPTNKLVEELMQRTGVGVFRTDNEDRYTIKTENMNIFEEDKLTTIRENTGPCVILEVID